ncbi:MAG: RNA polymerase sigma factor [Steroidobacteraceae bacterium]
MPDTSAEQSRALEGFLASVERSAFRMAQIALRHEQDALDAVQDSMLQLVRSYARRPAAQWKPLFYRILENRVRDLQRRRSVRERVMAWVPWRGEAEDADTDPVAQAPDPGPQPAAQLESQQMLAALEAALHALPARQRQAFLLRNLQGLDVAGTAAAMGCSEGSVKTHYFRALQALRTQLGPEWQ